MKYFFALAAVFMLITGARAGDTERARISFDVIEADKNVKASDVLPAVAALPRRKNPDGFKYLAGGDFTLAPFTEENFLLRQDGCELKLKLSWQPVMSLGVKKINLKYKAVLYYPLQTYASLEKSVELSSGSVVLIAESDSVSGVKDTRPVRVLLGAGFTEPSYGFANLGGIGARIIIKSGYPFITELLNDGSAKAAGLKTGDEITEVDGYSTLQLSVERLMALLQGDPGTRVKIKVHRAGNGSSEEKELTRRLLE